MSPVSTKNTMSTVNTKKTASKAASKALVFGVMTLTVLFSGILAGCMRGVPSDKPPIHVNPNMDSQPKYKAQGQNSFFDNGSNMRMPVAGTIARGALIASAADSAFQLGKTGAGDFIAKNPLPVTMDLLNRGQERYGIFCAPCHGAMGDGKGMVFLADKGMLPPTQYHSDRLRKLPDGHFFNVITNGIRNMKGYRHQIPVADRWAIVSYVRALQRSQNAALEDIPENLREGVK